MCKQLGISHAAYYKWLHRTIPEQGVIVAHKHIHVPTEMAEKLGLHDKQRVSVEAITERPVVFKDVIIRVSDNFRFRMHVDFDEANGADISGFTLGKIIR